MSKWFAALIAAVSLIVASCAANKPVEKPEAAGETPAAPAKAGPLQEPIPPDIMPDPEPPREQPEKPAEAPAAQPQEAAAEITQEEYKQMEAIGRMVTQAHAMYQQYFQKKTQNGTVDVGLLKSAIATYDAVIPKLEALLKKYPDSPELKMLLQQAAEERNSLQWEK